VSAHELNQLQRVFPRNPTSLGSTAYQPTCRVPVCIEKSCRILSAYKIDAAAHHYVYGVQLANSVEQLNAAMRRQPIC
jgi:hypothetical protein